MEQERPAGADPAGAARGAPRADRGETGPAERAVRTYLVPTFVAVAWWRLRAVVYNREWDDGPLIFLFVVAHIALVLATPALARRLGPREPSASRRGAERAVPALLIVASLLLLAPDLASLRDQLRREGAPLVDIGGNTWAAAVRFMDRGENPYRHRTQLHPVSGDPHVTEIDGRTEMFGVPYLYGYPYFPAMFLSYAPFRWIDPGLHSIRIGNAVLLALAAIGVGWLSYRLAPSGRGALAVGSSVLLLALAEGIGRQLFARGVTDLLPGVYLVFSLVAITYGRHLLAGALLGVAFACKLVPGLIAAPAILFWGIRRGVASRMAVGFGVAAGIILLPFVLWHPSGFFSATVLFYLTHHARGDGTSLWYHLPEPLQTPFLALGAILVLGVVAAPWYARFFGGSREGAAESRDRSAAHRALTRTVVVACFTFLAFNKMIHTNYQFAILPLACAVLAADALQPLGVRRRSAAAPATLPSGSAAARSAPVRS